MSNGSNNNSKWHPWDLLLLIGIMLYIGFGHISNTDNNNLLFFWLTYIVLFLFLY